MEIKNWKDTFKMTLQVSVLVFFFICFQINRREKTSGGRSYGDSTGGVALVELTEQNYSRLYELKESPNEEEEWSGLWESAKWGTLRFAVLFLEAYVRKW